jgi:hypothetical protein
MGRLWEMRLLALPLRLAFEDEFIGGRLQSVHRRLGQQWVGHHGQDFWRFSVPGGGVAVAFDDELVEVTGFGVLEPMQGQFADD